jgi:hypothetical protein
MAEYAEGGMVVRTGTGDRRVPVVGLFRGIAAGVALGLLEPPLALFIAAVPFVKMLSDQRAPTPVRFIGSLGEGTAKPVGSSGEGTLRLSQEPDK